MKTSKGIVIPRTEFKAIRTSLGSKVRLDKDNSFAFSFSFVFDKSLELIEAPRVKPPIKSLAHKLIPALSYSFKVFQNDSICVLDNLLAYAVVYPSYVAFLPSRDFTKQSLSRLCAFCLEFSPQIIMLHDSGLVTLENLAITTDSKVIYSDINTYNPVATTRNWGVDVSGKSDVKEHSSFSIFGNFKSLITPIQILPIIFRNLYWNILPLSWYKSGNPDLVKAKGKKVSVERDRARLHNRLLFELNRFKVFRSLCYGFTGKVSRKPLPQIFINKMMKLKSVAYLRFKSLVNSVLDSLNKGIAHINQFLIMPDFQLYGSDRFHIIKCRHRLYINLTPKCSMEVSLAPPPQ